MAEKDNKNTYYCVMQLSNKCAKKNGLRIYSDFYMSSSEGLFKNKKVHICKDCMKEFIYIDGNFNLEKFKEILRFVNYPFYQSEFESALNDKKETIGMYMKNITLNHKGSTWSNSDKDYDKNIVNNEIIETEDIEITESTLLFWGKNYSKEEYLFLNNYYNDLIRIYDHSLPVQVNNYRNMAKTQLQANKCLENGDMGGYDKAMKILSMLSGDSNIKPNQETSVGNLSKGGYDVFLKHIEDDEPILDWEKDLGNIDRLKSMLNVFFFGHLSKALNIINPWKSEYDDELKKYSVEDAEVEEDKTQVDFLSGD